MCGVMTMYFLAKSLARTGKIGFMRRFVNIWTPATLGNVLVRAKSRRIDHLRRARRMRSLVQEPAIVDCCTVEISDSFQAIMDCLPGLLRETIIQLRESEGDRRACCSALSISPELLRKRLQRMREMINNGCSQEPH